MDTDAPLAALSASAPRRYFAVGVLVSLGLLLVWMGAATPATALWKAVLVVIGLAAIYQGDRLRRATLGRVYLTEQGVFDHQGQVIAPIEAIVGVERGAFAFKPSNGFLIRLNTPGPRAWAPGLWWRMGRRVGIGGVTSAGAAKFMAERIALMIAERDQT